MVIIIILPKAEAVALGYEHFVGGLYAECFVPHIDMSEGTIDTVFSQRVRVALCAYTNLCLGDVVCPHTGISQEEALFGCEAIDGAKRIVAHGILQCVECHLQSAMVGEVLTECEVSVGIEVGKHLDGREEVGILLCPCSEVLAVGLRPPVGHVAVLIIVASLVVEAVSHLMTDDHSDGPIVERVVGCHVEERHLEYTCREANLVGGRVVVGVDGLLH